MNVNVPQDNQPIINGNRMDENWYRLFSAMRDWVTQNSQAGTTAQRPTTGLYVGRFYYDRTLGCPIWVHQVSPAVWHNGASVAV